MSLQELPLTHSRPLTAPPIETTLFDLFKTGPGPSSSHTMGPMKAACDFMHRCAELPEALRARATRVKVELLGSLSATGAGHGTNAAVLAGLMGYAPDQCPPGLLGRLETTPQLEHRLHMALPSGKISGGVPGGITEGHADGHTIMASLTDIVHGPVIHDKPYSNTLIFHLYGCDEGDAAGTRPVCAMAGSGGAGAQYSPPLFSKEYYSVGGGFIQWQGWTVPERGTPAHPYGSMRQLRARLHETGLTLHELILENETAITGQSRPSILIQLDEIMEAMYDSVRRGLAAEGLLPGTLGVMRKAGIIRTRALEVPHAVDRFIGQVNAYAFAAAEENAAGGVIVTAPTCGAAGVMPALLTAMRQNLNIGGRALREGVLASAAVGFLAKHNAGIAGAEVGCQGEVGVASAMAAAMLAHARGNAVSVVENAAEIALEHHLGLTCDPVGGYVQIPCIERNAVGAIKAYNACLLASCEPEGHHMVTLDQVIRAMGETGREMNSKYKETSEGGLAVSMVEC